MAEDPFLLQWQDRPRAYGGRVSVLYLGKWPVAHVGFSPMATASDPNKYGATITLPGIKSTSVHNGPSEEAVKEAVKAVVSNWVAGLFEPPPGVKPEPRTAG